MKIKKTVKALALLFTTLSFGAHADQDQRSYILATASTGGTYYPVGVALATLSKVKLTTKHNFSLSAISSAGSGENVKLLNDNEAQFAILQGLGVNGLIWQHLYRLNLKYVSLLLKL